MATLQCEHRFDPVSNRHYLNDQLTVLHCHHYATLFTQLALDAQDLADGPAVLKKSSESAFYKLLGDYVKKHAVGSPQEALDIAAQYFSAMGLGRYSVRKADENGGEVAMSSAHVDQGWIKKWGKNPKPVNLIGCGYLAAAWAVAYGKPLHSYQVSESKSLVSGDSESVFNVSR